jgi:hypothetical protein
MRRDKTRRQSTSGFEVGTRGGCEAHLFEFQEECTAEPRSVRIAAIKLDEALSYLRWHAPDFQIKSVQNLGLILLVSGSAVD